MTRTRCAFLNHVAGRRAPRLVALGLAVLLALVACSPSDAGTGVPAPALPSGVAAGGRPTPPPGATTSTGWLVTVYYNAVEQFHHGPPVPVTGCPAVNCVQGHDDLGSHPKDFVDAVRTEGTGRLLDGRYLNWAYDTGFWLDQVPRGANGAALRPFESAAADPSTLAPGTPFVITNCGHAEQGRRVDPTGCRLLSAGRWTVADELTPGLGGPHHVDLYVGDETGQGFTDSRWYLTLFDATLAIGHARAG